MGRRRRGFGFWDLFEIGIYLLPVAFLYWYSERALVVAVATVFAVVALFLILGEANRRIRLYSLDIAGVDAISGRDFEQYVAHLLRRHGYTVRQIGKQGDLGVDLIAKRGGVRYAIQIKRWKRQVGRQAVSDVVAGRQHYGCDKAVVITNSYFSQDAQKLALSTGCRLVDRDGLAAALHRIRGGMASTHLYP